MLSYSLFMYCVWRTACMSVAYQRIWVYDWCVSSAQVCQHQVCLLGYIIVGLSADIPYLVACVSGCFSFYILRSNLNGWLAPFESFYICFVVYVWSNVLDFLGSIEVYCVCICVIVSFKCPFDVSGWICEHISIGLICTWPFRRKVWKRGRSRQTARQTARY